jgi:DNA helicase INO80
MSLSSIMSSGADHDPPAKTQQLPSIHVDHRLSKPSPSLAFVKQEPMPSPAPADLGPLDNGILHRRPYDPVAMAGGTLPLQHFAQPRELPAPDEAEIEAALAHIETKLMNDVEGYGASADHDEWTQRNVKRRVEFEHAEVSKSKASYSSQDTTPNMLTANSAGGTPPSTASMTFSP